MKLKKLAVATALAISTAPVMAQNFEGTTQDDRIGATNNGNEDSIKIGRQNISLFQMSLQNNDWAEAVINLRWLVKNAPYAITGIYTQGPRVLYFLIKDETDPAKRMQYYKEMVELFDLREKNLEVLNTFAKTKSTLGDVLSVKADYLNWVAQIYPECGYTLNKSYENYSKAIKMINEKGGREIAGSVLQNFFLTSDAMYKNSPVTMREQYLQDYLDCKDACEKMLQLAKEAKAEGDDEKAGKLVAMYDEPLAAIEKTFSESGAADREQIIAIYTKKFDSYKEDINKLNNAINLMAQNDCDDADIYYQYAEAAYAIEPNFKSAIGLAQKAQKDGEMDKMLDYYNKALELAATDELRGSICLNISNALTKSKQFTGALTYAERAIEYNPDLTGKAYLKMANINALLGQYAKAIEYCQKAAEADITVSIAANRLKANIQTNQANQAANERARKAYEDFVRRQKAEEAFWTKGHK
jgi:tetratricopeptide (TPR) repeat protein